MERLTKKRKNYTLSLNISTDKVGWACLLPDNRILKVNDRLAMGVHEFREAQTAEERRNYRSTRRSLARKKKRLQLTQEVFKPLMEQEYPNFIQLNEEVQWQNDSTFHQSLTQVLAAVGLSKEDYPSIYHLRHALMTTDQKMDMRLIFIAVYNLIKKRGHFNFKGVWGENNPAQVYEGWLELLAAYEELIEYAFTYDSTIAQELDAIVRMDATNKEKLALVAEKTDKRLVPLVQAILGADIPLTKLFPLSENYGIYKETKGKLQLADEELAIKLEELTENEQLCVELMVQVQQVYTLETILGDFKTIAEAKVHAYAVFAADTQKLKAAFKAISRTQYVDMFRTKKAVLKAYEESPTKELFAQLCVFDRFLATSKETENFFKFVKKVLTDADASVPHRNEILEGLEKGTFLKRLKGRENSAIPLQNNVYELQMILKNQQAHYPQFTEEFTQRLIDIITFKIPFYVGPLGSGGYSPYAWLVRRTGETITPFNFNDAVDLQATNERWIQSLIANCHHVKGEKVLPAHSLLNQEFKLLNELNVIQFRLPNESPSEDARIPQPVKVWLMENVFKQKKKVTHKAVLKAIESSPFAEILYDPYTGETKQIFGTGKPTEFANQLTTWHTFKDILGDLMDVEMVENIVYWLSVYSETTFVEQKLEEHYPFLSVVQRKQILNLTLTGWGNVSRKFLEGIPVNSNGVSILSALRSRCVNLSILKKEYTPYLEKYNKPFMKQVSKFTYEQVEELAGSKAIKRGIWRTLKIVEEITSLFGEPTNIVLKVEREPDKQKKRSKTRKQQWLELQKKIPRADKSTIAFFEQYASEHEDTFKNDKFWLYVKQLGKCAFTGKPLAYDKAVLTTIYPKNAVFDGSMQNKVVVHQDVVSERTKGQMPLEMVLPHEAVRLKAYWQQLREYKLLSEGKYFRLLKAEFTEEDRYRSVEQQLVERRQIVKHVEQLLQTRFPKTEVYTVRQALIKAFRVSLDLPILEGLNAKYAAMDALLAALLVQFSVRKYGTYLFKFDVVTKENYEQLHKQFAKYQSKFFLFKDFEAPGAFLHKQTNEPIDVKAWLTQVNDVYEWQYTKMKGKTDEAFYDATLYSPKVIEAKYTSDKNALGVHSGLKKEAVYAIKVTVEKKNGKLVEQTKFVDLYNIEAKQWKSLPQESFALLLAEQLVKAGEQLVAAEVLYKLEKGQKILYQGKPFSVVSSGELENATPLQLPTAFIREHHALMQLIEWDNEKALALFNQLRENALAQLGHVFGNADTNKITAYQVTDRGSYVIGVRELLKACTCSPSRSDLFNGRFAGKSLKFEDVQVVNESVTGLRYRK